MTVTCVHIARSVLPLLLVASCAAPRPAVHGAELVGPSSLPRDCRTAEGALLDPNAPLAQVMRESINPALSRISFLLFHDPRPADSDQRTQELVDSARVLARCFVVVPKRDKSPDWTEFDLLAV